MKVAGEWGSREEEEDSRGGGGDSAFKLVKILGLKR